MACTCPETMDNKYIIKFILLMAWSFSHNTAMCGITYGKEQSDIDQLEKNWY